MKPASSAWTATGSPAATASGRRLAVDDHVDGEVEARETRRVDHLGVDGVAVEDARPGEPMTQHGQRVVAQDRVVARDRGQDGLGAAGEPGELVLLDLSQGDAQVGLPDPPVEEQLVAAARRADAHQVGSLLESWLTTRSRAAHSPRCSSRSSGCIGRCAPTPITTVTSFSRTPAAASSAMIVGRRPRLGTARVASLVMMATLAAPRASSREARRAARRGQRGAQRLLEVDVRRLDEVEPAHIAAVEQRRGRGQVKRRVKIEQVVVAVH